MSIVRALSHDQVRAAVVDALAWRHTGLLREGSALHAVAGALLAQGAAEASFPGDDSPLRLAEDCVIEVAAERWAGDGARTTSQD